jgi:hypothetical protein
MKCFRLYGKVEKLSQGKPIISVASSTSNFFQGKTVLLGKMTYRKSMVTKICSVDRIVSKLHGMKLSLQRRQVTSLMPMIKFRLLGENFKFGKLISVTVNLAAS